MTNRRNENGTKSAYLPELVSALVPDPVFHLHEESFVGQRIRRVVIEPRAPLNPFEKFVDHHSRYIDGILGSCFDNGLCTAALIVCAMVCASKLTKDATPVIPPNADIDQWLAARCMRDWRRSGRQAEVLASLAKYLPALLSQEFWMKPQVTVDQLLEEKTRTLQESEKEPAKITVYNKHGVPHPVLHVEINKSKETFSNVESFAIYVRQLALNVGITVESCIVLIQSEYSRTASDQRTTCGTLGIMGSYNDWRDLQNLARSMSPLFKTIALAFKRKKFASIHPSSRNMLTIVKPTSESTNHFLDRGILPREITRGAAVYCSLRTTMEETMTELGFTQTRDHTIG